MKTKPLEPIIRGMAMAALAIGLAAGCDEAETDSALAVDPARSEVVGIGATVLLTAFDPDQGVYTYSPTPDQYRVAKAAQTPSVEETAALSAQIILPLKWHVSNPALGRIASQGGYSAIYESFGGRGQNYITVKDQFGREGIAVVSQRFASESAE